MLNIASDDQSNAIDWLPSFFFFHLSSFFRSLDIHSDKSNRKISDCSNRCPYERLVYYLWLRVASCAATNEIIDCVFVDAASEIIVSCFGAGYGMGTIMEKYAWDVQMPIEHDDDIQVERLDVCVKREGEKNNRLFKWWKVEFNLKPHQNRRMRFYSNRECIQSVHLKSNQFTSSMSQIIRIKNANFPKWNWFQTTSDRFLTS